MSNKRMVPDVRFKGFEGEWIQNPLGKIGVFNSNGVDKLSKPNEQKVFLLNYMDVYNCRQIDLNTYKSLMEVTANARQVVENNIKSGDVFFTPSSETIDDIGHVWTINYDLPNTVYSYHLMRFRPFNNIFYNVYPNFGFSTDDIQKQIMFNAKGVQRFVLSKPDFENLIVKYPSISEQSKIAEFLTEVDNLITQTNNKLDKLKDVKKSLLNKMFPIEGKHVPEIRFKSFSENWNKFQFSELLDYERPDKYIVTSDKYSEFYKTPVLTANKGFLLGFTNETNTYNKSCILFDDFTLDSKYVNFPFMVKSSALKILTAKGNCNDYFIYSVINATSFELQGHARHYIEFVQPVKTLVPSLLEQSKIAEFLTAVDKLITLQDKKLNKLKKIKKALLQKMFV
ncbi:restriction endonuclease subunit S [Mycoplasmopsis felifaucium]|uniref:Restriction endonuclease subunit S n=1 Tax=Mycoplasmopsis felifaucium TaxID=35768 RepID=A0ABZ2RVP5_9BACT